MRLLRPHRQGIASAVCLLRDSLPVGIPTETVYGLAADATSASAIASVFAAKSRPSFDPLIVHLAAGDPETAIRGVAELGNFTSGARAHFVNLAHRFWPGPLTIVLPRSPNLSDLITAGLPTVAVRIPSHPIAQALLTEFGKPLVAPSANRFGRISPTHVAHVVDELDGLIPAVIDGGPCEVGVESTIVRIDPNGEIWFLRPGGVPKDAVEDVVGPVRHPEPSGAIEAPGQSASHYAPRTAAVLLPLPANALSADALRQATGGRGPVAVLRIVGLPDEVEAHLRNAGIDVAQVISLSVHGDLAEAARNLFSALRKLDDGPAELILFEPSPTDHGLGYAIADRIRRASAVS